MKELYFDLKNISENERLNIELLLEFMGRQLSVPIVFQHPSKAAKQFLFLDGDAQDFAENFRKARLQEITLVVISKEAQDLPTGVCFLLRPLRAKEFREAMQKLLNQEWVSPAVSAAEVGENQAKSLAEDDALSFFKHLLQLRKNKGFMLFVHPVCQSRLLVYRGELLLDKPLPDNFFEAKPDVSFSLWQERALQSGDSFKEAQEAATLIAYMLLFDELLIDQLTQEVTDEAILLNKFPSFVFTIPHFRLAWSSAAARNALLRAALRMQGASGAAMPCSVNTMVANKVPLRDAVKFYNLMLILGCGECVPSSGLRHPLPKSGGLAARIRKHLGISSS